MIYHLVEVFRVGQYGIKPTYRHSCRRYINTGKRCWCQSASGQTKCWYSGKSSSRLIHCKAAPVYIHDLMTTARKP